MIRSAIAAVFALSLGSGAGAMGGGTYNYTTQYDFYLDMSGGCAQEPIHFTGSGHTVLQQSLVNGVWTYRGHLNTQGMKGVGMLTNRTYNLNLVDRIAEDFAVDGSEFDFVYTQRYNVIGEGNGGSHFMMSVVEKVSMAQGVATASVYSVQAKCK
ncbi:MAG: hypothetical protein NVS4B3_27700 [Gemmatimonadaceae bacterium]